MLKQLCSPVNCFSNARCHVSCRKVTRRQHLRKKTQQTVTPTTATLIPKTGGVCFKASAGGLPIFNIFYKDTNLETAPRTEAAKPQKTPFKTQARGLGNFSKFEDQDPVRGLRYVTNPHFLGRVLVKMGWRAASSQGSETPS